ncbi:DUF86 domain-containing protein [Dyadobacter sp. Leaf189]|uniref:HepT-like ribonuclease domain-containing protein n=1 Tax=Dyadobacter sp. Leaf189 TaxID=1736295 RepID=UPI0006F282FB|nr:HepT-like ribonuclease domain-containing protein [Dyadobacter sp. Leaf189]KQS25433.1 hypothetical protein ASG33_22290 [Dyadobacter sp. Leaf189]
MIRDDKVYIEDIIQSIQIIQEHLEGKTEQDFEGSLLLQDAVYRRFEIIGEAASKVSEQFKKEHPAVEWRLMKLMRNKLIHEYFGISPASIFATVQEDLPQLLSKLNPILY